MRRTHASGRAGYTLVEILVVMGLMLLLAALAAAVGYSGLIGSQRVVGAADRASGWLLIAKQQAGRDRAPRGVRFIGTPDGTGAVYFREAQYIEAPEAFVPNPNQESNPQGPRLVFVYEWGGGAANPNLANGNSIVAREVYFVANDTTLITEFYQRVGDGDTLILPEFNATYRIQSRGPAATPVDVGAGTPFPGAQAVRINLQSQPDLAAAGTRSAAPPATGRLATLVTYKFAFQGQARPLLGEPVLQLTNGMAIDYRLPGTTGYRDLSAGAAPYNPTTTSGVSLSTIDSDGKVTFDILFSPSGQVLGNASSLVCLWVRNPENVPHPRQQTPADCDPIASYNAAGDQVLVVVSTRSGLISTQPVNPPPVPLALFDPYLFAKDGQNNGL